MTKRTNGEVDSDESFILEEEEEEEEDLAKLGKSPSSSITSATGFLFSRGSHGQLIKTQQHPRKKTSTTENKNKKLLQFAERFFGADLAEAQDHIRIYRDASKGIQEGMLSAFICLKNDPLSQQMANIIYGIGSSMWTRIKNEGLNGAKERKKRGGRVLLRF